MNAPFVALALAFVAGVGAAVLGMVLVAIWPRRPAQTVRPAVPLEGPRSRQRLVLLPNPKARK